MRSIDSPTVTALSQGQLIIRHFLWITPRDLVTGAQLTPVGFWNDIDFKTLNVIDGISGASVSRTYAGSGKIADLDQLVHEIGIAVRTATITLNVLDATVETLVRGTQLRKAPVEWHIGLLNVSDRNPVSTPYPLLVGFVNSVKIGTPGENAQGGVLLELVSDTRRLTIKSGLKRSDENQRLRSDDRAFKYAEAMRVRQLFWGTAKAAGGTSAAVTAAASAAADARRRRGILGI